MSTSRFTDHLVTDRVDPLPLSSTEVARYSLARAIEAAGRGNPYAAEFEFECSREIAKRAGAQLTSGPHSFFLPPQVLRQQRRDLTVAAGPGGGYLVETEVVGVLDALRNRLVCTRMGAVALTGLRGSATYVSQGASATITWQMLENEQAAETVTLSLGSIAVAPHTVCAYIEESNVLAKLAPDLAEQMIRRDLAAALAVAADAAALNGSGAAGQPSGLLQASGIGTFNGSSVAYADVLEAETDVLEANALRGTGEIAFVCRPAVAKLLAQRQAFSDQVPMWTGPLSAGQLIGCPGYTSMNMPATTLIGGDWSQLLLAEWGAGVEIRVNPYADFKAALNGYAAFLTMDVAALHAASFSVATSVS